MIYFYLMIKLQQGRAYVCDEGGGGTEHGGRQWHGGGSRGHGDGGGGGAGEAVRAQAPVYVVSVEKLENIIININIRYQIIIY